MIELRFTLISDGSSDKALMPILHWLLTQYYPDVAINGDWADLASLRTPPANLEEKIVFGCQLYPCDLLFIHRDAENMSLDTRRREILEAVSSARKKLGEIDKKLLLPDHVCVIPVRMTEAWLLFDIDGIRKAASNPNGKIQMSLPSLANLENIPNPKEELFGLLRAASELKGRRLKKFNPRVGVHRLAQFIDDYSPLRRLSSFQALENEIKEIVI